jgi:hypothetical protein
MRFVYASIVFVLMLLASSCKSVLNKPTSANETILDSLLSVTERLTIKSSHYRGCSTIVVSYHQERNLSTLYLRQCPERFVIDKYSAETHGANSVRRMVTDTIANQLACLDYSFLDKYNTPDVLKTFLATSAKEQLILKILSQSLEHRIDLPQLNLQEIKLMKGWVKIEY